MTVPFTRLCCAALMLLAPVTHTLAQRSAGDEYDQIGYFEADRANPVARLSQALDEGGQTLQWQPGRGYFDSLLAALEISPDSQTMVFSPTSLQDQYIHPSTPRAIYFSDDSYVAWVQGSPLVEIAVMDAEKGMLFYIFGNSEGRQSPLERHNQDCLVCHDSNGTTGGGVPELLVLSSVYDKRGSRLQQRLTGKSTNDSTPLSERWGGWFVTGDSGEQSHLGNVLLEDASQLASLDAQRQPQVDNLSSLGVFDTAPYLRDTSDITALLLMEHQLTVQNRLTYILFKAPAVLARIGQAEAASASHWEALPPRGQQALRRMLEGLLDDLFFVNAAPFEDSIRGSADYQDWFEAQGPEDAEGRSLRELDLETRLLKYGLSYLVYSEGFGGLPAYAQDYVHRRIAEVIDGREQDERFAHISAQDRENLRQIMVGTLPAVAAHLQE